MVNSPVTRLTRDSLVHREVVRSIGYGVASVVDHEQGFIQQNIEHIGPLNMRRVMRQISPICAASMMRLRAQ